MHAHALTALSHPVFDPEAQMSSRDFFWRPDRHISAGLTVNIGME